MKQVEERYISLLTDFGFKRIFGSAPNKDLLICFLNSLFNGRQVVKDVKYLNPENVGDIYTDRKALCDKVFDRLFEEAEIAKFTPQEQREYEASKMAYRDIKNSIDTAKREGKEEGLAEGMEKGLAEGMEKGLAEGMEKGLAEGMEKGLAEGMEKGMNQRSLEIARKMLENGMDAATVMEITGLSEEEMLQINP